jgi:hypothetical protein
MLITLFSKGGDRLRELLGEGQEVLDFPTKILKPIPGLIVGLVVGWGSMVVVRSTDGLFVDFLYVPSFPSCTFMHPLTHPLIHHHLCLGLGREANC